MLRNFRMSQLADLEALLRLLLSGIHDLLNGETLTLNRRVPSTASVYPPFQGA